jgi:hypothetical protein
MSVKITTALFLVKYNRFIDFVSLPDDQSFDGSRRAENQLLTSLHKLIVRHSRDRKNRRAMPHNLQGEKKGKASIAFKAFILLSSRSGRFIPDRLVAGQFISDRDAILVLLKKFVSDAFDIFQFFNIGKRPVGFPVFDNPFGVGLSDAGQLHQRFRRSRVDIDLWRRCSLGRFGQRQTG